MLESLMGFQGMLRVFNLDSMDENYKNKLTEEDYSLYERFKEYGDEPSGSSEYRTGKDPVSDMGMKVVMTQAMKPKRSFMDYMDDVSRELTSSMRPSDLEGDGLDRPSRGMSERGGLDNLGEDFAKKDLEFNPLKMVIDRLSSQLHQETFEKRFFDATDRRLEEGSSSESSTPFKESSLNFDDVSVLSKMMEHYAEVVSHKAVMGHQPTLRLLGIQTGGSELFYKSKAAVDIRREVVNRSFSLETLKTLGVDVSGLNSGSFSIDYVKLFKEKGFDSTDNIKDYLKDYLVPSSDYKDPDRYLTMLKDVGVDTDNIGNFSNDINALEGFDDTYNPFYEGTDAYDFYINNQKFIKEYLRGKTIGYSGLGDSFFDDTEKVLANFQSKLPSIKSLPVPFVFDNSVHGKFDIEMNYADVIENKDVWERMDSKEMFAFLFSRHNVMKLQQSELLFEINAKFLKPLDDQIKRFRSNSWGSYLVKSEGFVELYAADPASALKDEKFQKHFSTFPSMLVWDLLKEDQDLSRLETKDRAKKVWDFLNLLPKNDFVKDVSRKSLRKWVQDRYKVTDMHNGFFDPLNVVMFLTDTLSNWSLHDAKHSDFSKAAFEKYLDFISDKLFTGDALFKPDDFKIDNDDYGKFVYEALRKKGILDASGRLSNDPWSVITEKLGSFGPSSAIEIERVLLSKRLGEGLSIGNFLNLPLKDGTLMSNIKIPLSDDREIQLSNLLVETLSKKNGKYDKKLISELYNVFLTMYMTSKESLKNFPKTKSLRTDVDLYPDAIFDRQSVSGELIEKNTRGKLQGVVSDKESLTVFVDELGALVSLLEPIVVGVIDDKADVLFSNHGDMVDESLVLAPSSENYTVSRREWISSDRYQGDSWKILKSNFSRIYVEDTSKKMIYSEILINKDDDERSDKARKYAELTEEEALRALNEYQDNLKKLNKRKSKKKEESNKENS